MQALAIALKPVLKEVINEEFMDKVKDLEVKVDKADEAIEGLKSLDPRVEKLEKEVEDLKKRMAKIEASHSSGASAAHAPTANGFTPTYVEIKGYCSWDERREKGLTRTQATQMHGKLKAALPAELQEHFGDLVLNGMFANKLRIKTTAEYNLDVRASLTDIFKSGEFNINGVVPYVVSERSPARQVQFSQYGKIVDVIKKANKDKAETQEIVVEPRYCSVFVKLQGEERPKFIAEVTRDGKISWDDDNCERFLGAKGAGLEAKKSH